MCDVNGPFKLCTCSEEVNKNKPHWTLKSDRKNSEFHAVHVGLLEPRFFIFTPFIKRHILRRMNSKTSVFDFEYVPKEKDLLVLRGEYESYFLEYNNNKWNWIDEYEFIQSGENVFRNELCGPIEGARSELKKVIKEYENLTGKKLYRNLFRSGPKDEFEEKLLSLKGLNQKKLISIIKERIEKIGG